MVRRVGGSDHRIVVLVLANKAAALRVLLRLLDKRFRIIIHRDAKTDATGIELPAHASFTAVRLPIFWGGFNIMLAIREMLDEAYRVAPDFWRAVLLTGDTLPLLPDRLEAELLDEVREYIQLTEVPNDPSLRGLRMQEAQARGSLLAWRFQNFTYFDDEMLSPRSRNEFIRKLRCRREYRRLSSRRGREDRPETHIATAAESSCVQPVLLR